MENDSYDIVLEALEKKKGSISSFQGLRKVSAEKTLQILQKFRVQGFDLGYLRKAIKEEKKIMKVK